MSIAKKVADLIPSSEKGTSKATEDDNDDTVPTELYECEPCKTTYISGSMEECPNCEGDVESVRSEKELDML